MGVPLYGFGGQVAAVHRCPRRSVASRGTRGHRWEVRADRERASRAGVDGFLLLLLGSAVLIAMAMLQLSRGNWQYGIGVPAIVIFSVVLVVVLRPRPEDQTPSRECEPDEVTQGKIVNVYIAGVVISLALFGVVVVGYMLSR